MKSWQVNCGWVIAANIAVGLAARTAFPATATTRTCGKPTRARSAIGSSTSLPGSLVSAVLESSLDRPWTEAFLTCWERHCVPRKRPPGPPYVSKGACPDAAGGGTHPGHTLTPAPPPTKQTPNPTRAISTISNRTPPSCSDLPCET